MGLAPVVAALLLVAGCSSAPVADPTPAPPPSTSPSSPAPSTGPVACETVTIASATGSMGAPQIAAAAAVDGRGRVTATSKREGAFITASSGAVTVGKQEQTPRSGTVELTSTENVTVTPAQVAAALPTSIAAVPGGGWIDGPLYPANGRAGGVATLAVDGPTLVARTTAEVTVAFTGTCGGPARSTPVAGTAVLYVNPLIAAYSCRGGEAEAVEALGPSVAEWCRAARSTQ